MKGKSLLKNTDLKLPLNFQWYDEIVYGDKREEYREITAYWVSRLLGVRNVIEDSRVYLKKINHPDIIQAMFKAGFFFALPYKTVTFRRGYTRETKTFRITGIDIRQGNPKWGAKPGKKYFVISFSTL